MRISALTLEHFRSYDSLVLSFDDKGRQFFCGDNGSGKTNIVEAVSVLSQGRSCLKADLQNLVRFGGIFYKIRAEIVADDGEASSVESVFQTSPRRASAYFIKDIKAPLLSFIGVLPTIIFLPQDLDLFTGSPSGRRNFLDSLLSQLRPDYAAMRLEYERVLKQRNALLKRIAQGEAKESELDVWDTELATAGSGIVSRRSDALSTIGELLPAELERLAEKRTGIRVVPAFTGSSEQDPKTALLEVLQKYRSRDVILQTTTVGPHRDDWSIEDDSRDIAAIASRGQQRSILLALLFVNAALFKTVRRERPVILLDDVLSELDEDHQQALLTHLEDHQVIITSTHPVAQTDDLAVWTVRDGEVMPLR
ncbi:MAG: DNA replication/repair protein RecF [Candidatus Peribacteraceae bacterium]|nr:DNA replication/repair protein RecF [Candidatus Peribacteraceae bacterium]